MLRAWPHLAAEPTRGLRDRTPKLRINSSFLLDGHAADGALAHAEAAVPARHDVEAGHEDDVARGLEADDALLLAFVLDGSVSFFLGDLRRRGGEGVTGRRSGRGVGRASFNHSSRASFVASPRPRRGPVKSSLAVRVKIELELSARSPKSTGALRPLSKS